MRAKKPTTWIEIINGKRYRAQRVTGQIARILTGRNSYLAYILVNDKSKAEPAG